MVQCTFVTSSQWFERGANILTLFSPDFCETTTIEWNPFVYNNHGKIQLGLSLEQNIFPRASSIQTTNLGSNHILKTNLYSIMKCEHSDLNLSYSFQRSLKADDSTNNISQLLQISSSPYPKKVQHSCLTIKPSLVVWIKIQREEFEMIFHRIFPVCWVCIKICLWRENTTVRWHACRPRHDFPSTGDVIFASAARGNSHESSKSLYRVHKMLLWPKMSIYSMFILLL